MSSHTFESLAQSSLDDLEELLQEKPAPTFADVVGYEWRGWNVLAPFAKPVAGIMGIQRFAKGFFTRGSVEDVANAPYIEGYNIKIARGGLTQAWTHLGGGGPTRFAFYKCFKPGDELARRGGRYPNALFLDYLQGDPPNGLLTGKGLRDYVVKISDDLIIGRAKFTLGPLTVDGGIFITARWRKADFVPPAATAAMARAA